MAARREDKGEGVVRKIEALGGEGFFIKTDVTKRNDVEALVNGTVAKFGKLDCAVNNAGIAGPVMTPVAEIDEDDWDALMDTNLKAVWMCMKFEILAMLEQSKGAIVNVSSIYGFKGSDLGHAPYATSKFGVIALSRSAAIDYAQRGIRINVVSPGFTHSESMDPVVDAAPELMRTVLSRHSAMNRDWDTRKKRQRQSLGCVRTQQVSSTERCFQWMAEKLRASASVAQLFPRPQAVAPTVEVVR